MTSVPTSPASSVCVLYLQRPFRGSYEDFTGL